MKKPRTRRGFKNLWRLRLAYAAALVRTARRDFLRSAFAEWMTPSLAALSYADADARSAASVFSLLPSLMASLRRRSAVLRVVFTERLRACLAASLRIRRLADLILGIVQKIADQRKGQTTY